jgi:four helix bundle protein
LVDWETGKLVEKKGWLRMTGKGMNGFEDLECYQLGKQVFREAYRVASLLPVEEKYNLTDQMRRAAVSIVLNIAEGYGRYHYLDCLRFYYIARGSIDEVLSAFIACDELHYTQDEISAQRELCHSALRSLNGYIRYVRGLQQGKQEYGERTLKEETPSYQITNLPYTNFPNINLPSSQDTNLPASQDTTP